MKTISYSTQAFNELKNIIESQNETMQMMNENMSLLRRELTNLQRRVYDINSRLVETEEWIDDQYIRYEEQKNESKL